MARDGRSMTAVLAAMAAVLMVIVGTAVATGWHRPGDDPPGSDGSKADRSASDRADLSTGGRSARDRAGNDRAGTDVAAPAGGSGAATDAPAAVVPAPPDVASDAAVTARAGVLVAHGVDLSVERVDLAGVVSVEVAGEVTAVSSVYRVVVSAGPYRMQNMPAVLSVDGVPLGVAAETADLSSLVLYTYDDVVSVPGGSLELTHGPPGVAPVEWSATIEALA